jgi:hypothetical protein
LKLSVGDIVHNEVTHEEGRIVRIAKIRGQLRYVVVTATKPFGKEIEALWRPRELKEVRDRAAKYSRGNQDFPGDVDFDVSSILARHSCDE